MSYGSVMGQTPVSTNETIVGGKLVHTYLAQNIITPINNGQLLYTGPYVGEMCAEVSAVFEPWGEIVQFYGISDFVNNGGTGNFTGIQSQYSSLMLFHLKYINNQWVYNISLQGKSNGDSDIKDGTLQTLIIRLWDFT